MDEAKASGRGRKRKTDDSMLSPEEQEKKKKNRDAAKKCREKKEKEAQELKQRNTELENENSNLSKEKIKLLDKIKEFKDIICNHMQKGCKLPPDIEQVLFHEGPLDDDFREVGYMETPVDPRMHTPPHTPDSSSSSDQLSSPVSFRPRKPAPTALFSGTPLTVDECNKKNNRSPSRSPGPQGSTFYPTPTETKELSHILLNSKNLPPVLNPIQVPSSKTLTPATQRNQFPTVVIDDDDDDDDVHVCTNVVPLKQRNQEVVHNQKLHWVPVAEQPGSSTVLNKAFEHPDIPSEDAIAKQLFEKDDGHYSNQPYEPHRNNSGSDAQNENLQSLGFNSNVQSLPEGYSYTEDLAEELPNNISEFTNETVQYAPQEVESQEEADTQITNSSNSQDNAVTSHDFPLGVLSSAILALGSSVSDQLQEQIKKQFPTPDHSQQPEQHIQYVVTSNHSNPITRLQQAVPASNESYINVIDSNKLTSLNAKVIQQASVQHSGTTQLQTAASQQFTVQKYNNGQPAINVNKQLYSQKFVKLSDGRIALVQTGTILPRPVQVIRVEQASQNIEQEQPSSSMELNLPSLNFDDLQQNDNIFDKTRSKTSTSS